MSDPPALPPGSSPPSGGCPSEEKEAGTSPSAPPPGDTYAERFRAGFLAMLPLWAGVVPFALAFSILARTGHFSVLQTQAFSLFVFAGSAQVAAVTLAATGTVGIFIILTVLLLNVRHVLYGLSLGPMLESRPRPPRAVLAYFLTDEAYGVTVRAFLDGRGSTAFLLGAELSLFLSFNVATLAGSLLGTLIVNPERFGLDFVFPLTFLALLIPLLRSRTQVGVAVASGLTALVLTHFFAQGLTIFVSAVAAAALGATIDRRHESR